MAHKGFVTEPASIIRQIRENLRRYPRGVDGQSILKELVQNADDAGATVLDVGLAPPLADAEHPLLSSGPALFVVNNGPLKESDLRHLRSFGLNRKAGEAEAIGKFGLGLKSILHWCEAFFFQASHVEGRPDLAPPADILNPWSAEEGGLHPEWDTVSANSHAAIQRRLGPLLSSPSWFCLWIPLRRHGQLNGKAPIDRYCPGDMCDLWQSIVPADTEARLVELLPLLAKLRTMRLWQSHPPNLRLVTEVSLNPDFIQRRKFEKLRRGEVERLGGVVVLKSSGGSPSHQVCAGMEMRHEEPSLLGLMDHPNWPDDTATDPETGEEKQIKEKARNHVATCFVAGSSVREGGGHLSVRWSTFLPLSDPEVVPISGGVSDVTLLLHGYFFIDAGRNRVDGLDDRTLLADAPVEDTPSLRRAWNVQLAKGSLSLIPQALEVFARQARYSLMDTSALTRAIQETSHFRDHREHICRDFQWILCLMPSGELAWRLLPAIEPFLALPNPARQDLAAEVFPAVSILAAERHLTHIDTPRLVHERGKASWPESFLAKMLESVDAERVFHAQEQLEYLVEFLELALNDGMSSNAATTLVEFVRRAFKTVGLQRLSEVNQVVRRIIKLLPADRRKCVILDTSIDEDILQALISEPSGILLVPSSLETEPGSTGALLGEYVARLWRRLKTLTDLHSTARERESIAEVAAQLLPVAGIERTRALGDVGDLRLFAAADASMRTVRLVSFNDIDERRTQDLLFAQPPSYVFDLQAALAEDRLLLLSGAVAKRLFPSGGIVQCRHEQILNRPRRAPAPRLCEAANRRNLLETLLSYREGARVQGYNDAVRYLLHGSRENVGSQLPLLVARARPDDVWSKITEHALQHLDARWCLVPPELGAVLSPEQRSVFRIEEVGVASALELVRKAGPECLKELHPTEQEYERILIETNDLDLLRSLPIHRDLEERFVSIGPHTYWETSFDVDPALLQSIVILRLSNSEPMRRRQRDLAQELDPTAVIGIALQSGHLDRHWKCVMDAVGILGSPPDKWIGQLQSAKWLPTRHSASASPGDIIYLPSLADDVARITTEYPGTFLDELALAPEVRDHPAYVTLRDRLFPATHAAVEMLGILLVDRVSNHVGEFSASDLSDWLDAMHGVPADLIPSYQLIKRVVNLFDDIARCLWAQLAIPIPAARTVELLGALSRAHEGDSTRHQKAAILRIYNRYLEQLVASGDLLQDLRQIRCLSRTGTWKSTRDICLDASGIDGEHLLDEASGEVLAPFFKAMKEANGSTCAASSIDLVDERDRPPRDDHGPLSAEVEFLHRCKRDWETAADRLEGYFAPWRGLVADEEIGGFLALLSDDVKLRELASHFLGNNRSIAQTRANFGLPDDQAANHRVMIEISEGNIERIPNLLGELFDARKSSQVATLFVGTGSPRNPFPRHTVFGCVALRIRLNHIDPRTIPAEKLSGLLRESAARFLNLAYDAVFHEERVAQAWEDLSESDQLDIRIAQARLIENGFLLLDQLGLRDRSASLATVLDRWDLAQRLEAEQMTGQSKGRRVAGIPASQHAKAARDELRRLFESDDPALAHILEAVRHRIHDYYQYTLDSIPFEIFQNADDAYVELDAHFADDGNREAVPSIEVRVTEQTLSFLHFGRRINQYPMGAERSEALRFDNDLWKMLVLSLSNKSAWETPEHASVTGKFGLGFKSVFLASDRPRVLSGRLVFEIVGGMYPRHVSGDDHNAIEAAFELLSDRRRRATVVELTLRDGVDPDALLRRFSELVPFLLVFAKKIRRIAVSRASGESDSGKWSEHEVAGVQDCFIGRLDPLVPAGRAPLGASQLLVFRGPRSCVVFGLDARQIVPFASEIPTIWVTAPTQESLGCGFLVNGPFALDVGRAQLSRDVEYNRQLAAEIGDYVGGQLCELFKATVTETGWSGLRAALGLVPDADRYDFWESVWMLVARDVARNATREVPADQVVREMLWGTGQGGAARLYGSEPAIPTGLTGEYRTLTAIASIRYSVDGLLADESVLQLVSSWSSFRRHAPVGSLVADADVIQPLRKLSPGIVPALNHLTLRDVLEWELEHGREASPRLARHLGGLISKDFVDSIRDWSEQQRIRSWLKSLEFLGRDGCYHPAQELLIPVGSRSDANDRHEDERLRAAFAPPSAILHAGYHDRALAFFEICREKLEAPVKRLADWILSTDGPSIRFAALQYLADGEQRDGLQYHLLQHGLTRTWLDALRTQPLFGKLAVDQQHRLAKLLGPSLMPLYGTGFEGHPTVCCSAAEVLPRIHAWWLAERNRRLPAFLGRLYPEGSVWLRDHQSSQRDDPQRPDWMILFVLGMLHTMGRTRPDQDRAFLEQCKQRGWLDIFVSPESDAKAWLSVIAAYVDEQVDESRFLQWMKQFVGIFAVGRRLDDYIESFLAIERRRAPFALTDITESKASPIFAGGGISAPPVSRILGIGACFVVRELVRSGTLANPHSHEHCYVPARRVRGLLEAMGCPPLNLESRRWERSREIHAFLVDILGAQKATFCGDFDIPLQIVAGDPELRLAFLNVDVPELPSEDDDDCHYDVLKVAN